MAAPFIAAFMAAGAPPGEANTVDASTDVSTAALLMNPNSLSRTALSAAVDDRAGRVYRPEQYGAIGDGVSNDYPAFQAMATAINADANTPARIVITREHYLSNGVSFDAENIECHLAAGSHVFTKAATNVGHTLGFIGHLGIGDAVAPTRARVHVFGPGKVTGWRGVAPSTAPNNENAIGVVRYRYVEIDGPQDLEAGNKAVTAQIGVQHVKINNIGVKRANHRAVSVEDHAGPVDIQNVYFESCGSCAVLASGTSALVRNITGNQAVTGRYPTEAAVRVTGTALTTATVEEININSAGSGKGLIIAKATNLVLVDRVRIGASTGNAVDIQDTTGAIYVGVLEAPASPGQVVAVGTTRPSAIIRMGQPDPSVVTLSATRFSPVAGSPAVGLTGPQLPGYLLDSKAAEAVSILLGRDSIPDSWKHFAIDLVWTNTTASAGNVRHDASYSWLGDGDSFNVGTYVNGTAAAAPKAFGTLKVSRVVASIAADKAKNLYLRIIRVGNDVSDTLANDSGLVAVKLVRLT